MSIVIRHIQKWVFQQVIALCAAVQPERVRELKVHLRQVDEPGFVAEQDLQQWVAVEDETRQCVGFASFWNVVRQKYRMNLMVRPDWRRRRVGGKLFETILTALQTTLAATVQARTWDNRTDSLEFLDRRGFCEVHRMIELQVKLSEANLSPFAELPARLTAQGIQFITWREASTDEYFWAKLIDLQSAAIEGWPDPDPDDEITKPTEEQVRRIFHSWQTTPDAFWLARAGELYLGYSALGPDDSVPGLIGTGPTAVRPEYRGRGIATALKAICLNYAREQGWQLAITRSANPAMICVNEKFGFKRGHAEVRLVRKLPAEPDKTIEK